MLTNQEKAENHRNKKSKMMNSESLEKIQEIINNQRQPKKRISKACIKCKNSKNKCINIEKGVCERCVELNEICIYDYSSNTTGSSAHTHEDSKVLISKEYLTLLQNKTMLCELVLKKMFNNFDKLVANGFLTVDEEKTNTTSEEELWRCLVKKNTHFCNPGEVNTNYNHMTNMYKSNLEINPLIQMVLPRELDLATRTLNSINDNHVGSVFNEQEEYALIDRSHEVVPNDPEQKKKRRRTSKSENGHVSVSPRQTSEMPNYQYIHQNTGFQKPSFGQVLPTLATIGLHSNGPTPTNSPTSHFSHPQTIFKLPPLRLSVSGSLNNSNSSRSNSSSAQTLVPGKEERSRIDLKMILNNDPAN